MATIKAVYRKDSIYIRIYHQTTKYKKIISIEEKYWNSGQVKNSHPNCHRINTLISNRISKYQARILDLEISGQPYTHSDIWEDDENRIMVSEVIFNYARQIFPDILSPGFRKYKNAADKIISFGDIPVIDINIMYVRGWLKYLNSLDSINSPNTVHRYLKFLKTPLRNHGIDLKDIDKIKLPQIPSNKTKLTKEEFKRIESYTGQYELEKDIFSAMIYTAGTRIGDILMLEHRHIQKDRLIWKEQKSGKTKTKDIIIIPQLQDLINKYKGQSLYYIFPVLDFPPANPTKNHLYRKHIQSKYSVINKHLKVIAAGVGITKNISCHVARHTFATWGDNQNISTKLLKNILNHGDEKTTKQYIQELKRSDEIDDAIIKIVG